MEMLSAAVVTGSAARSAQRAVVWTWVCPKRLPIVGRPWPAATAVETKAKVGGKSWIQMSFSPARARTRCQKGWRSLRRAPGFVPTMTQGFFSTRSIFCRTSTAG